MAQTLKVKCCCDPVTICGGVDVSTLADQYELVCYDEDDQLAMRAILTRVDELNWKGFAVESDYEAIWPGSVVGVKEGYLFLWCDTVPISGAPTGDGGFFAGHDNTTPLFPLSFTGHIFGMNPVGTYTANFNAGDYPTIIINAV